MLYPIEGLPEDLSAQELYELGLKYRIAGWVGVAREALQRAAELDKTGRLGSKARKVLRTQLPRVEVPIPAEQKNIEAFNLMQSDREEAKKVFQELMNTYPDFEWPFSNTARIKLAEGDISGAKSIVKYLLQVNPDLLSAIDLMIRISIAEKDLDQALTYLDRALELYPHEEEFKQLKLAIRLQAQGEPAKEIPEGLTPEENFALGLELQAVGRLEDARVVMQRVVDNCPSEENAESKGKGKGDGAGAGAGTSDLKERAKEFIRTQLPRNPICVEAQQRCIDALKSMATDQKGSKQSLIDLTMEYPDFEWPFLFLGNLYMLDGSFRKAERLIRRVIKGNPDLIKAKHLLITVYFVEGRYGDALTFIDEAISQAQNDDDSLAFDLLKAQCQLQSSR
ncbi:MAG: tetratricopeptide repeat protein [Cyanobacteriota/Melainabacteria group bacterium]